MFERFPVIRKCPSLFLGEIQLRAFDTRHPHTLYLHQFLDNSKPTLSNNGRNAPQELDEK